MVNVGAIGVTEFAGSSKYNLDPSSASSLRLYKDEFSSVEMRAGHQTELDNFSKIYYLIIV